MKHPLLICVLALLPFVSIAQKINIKGNVAFPKAEKIAFERLKGPGSWKVWKDAKYEAKVDSSGEFKISFSIADSGFWKISVGNRKAKIHLNVHQNLFLELDSELVVKKMIRQDLIDSPLGSSF
jgi:hypothetical protein